MAHALATLIHPSQNMTPIFACQTSHTISPIRRNLIFMCSRTNPLLHRWVFLLGYGRMVPKARV